MNIGDRLLELRNKKGLSQKEIAKYLDISRDAYATYETNRSEMKYALLVKLSQFHDVTTDYLLGLEELKPIKKGNVVFYTNKEDDKDVVTDEELRAALELLRIAKKGNRID